MCRCFLFLLLVCAGRLMALPVNLAPGGVESGSSAAYGSVVKDANDGNRDGGFYSGGSVWHTAIPDAAPFFQVDLGATYYLDRVMIWPRTDAVQNTVETIRIKVLNAADAIVWQQVFLNGVAANNPWGTNAMRGVQGRKVRVERADSPVSPNWLTCAEIEVWGQTNPVPPNLALNKPYTAVGAGGFSTPANAGNDGEIGGDYNLTGRPVYHSSGTGTGLHYEVDLSNGAAVNQTVDYVRVFNRTDHTNAASVLLTLRNNAGVTVWTQVTNIARETIVLGGRQYDITVDVPGTVEARWARIETVAPVALSFAELEVFGPDVDITPPQIIARSPEPGELVAELITAEVFFSEDVTGVHAADLLVNGAPAASLMALEPRRALFAFPQPGNGVVQFTWAAAHGITDTAANALAAAPWSVTLDNTLPAPQPYISELLADNRGGLKDTDGDSPDWVEITNPGPTVVNLGNWYLTDAPGALTKWQFPSPTLLPAGRSLVVFASSKDRRVSGAELHTNWKLDPDGESVLLVKPDGVTIASQILNFPPQQPNVSYGVGRRLNAAPVLAAGAPGRISMATPAAGWEARLFNDSAWAAVTSGVGFDQTGGLNGKGPLALWTFNDNAASATDATGRGNTGTIVNATYTADAGGRSGAAGDRAMSFAGNGVIHVPAAATGNFDAITARDAFTVAAWFYGGPTQPAASYAFLAMTGENASGLRAFGAHLPWTDSVIYWDTANCCDGGRHRIFIGEPNPAMWRGAWNHYAFVKKGSRKEIWQNGSIIHSGINVDVMPNFRSLYIGAANAAGGSGYPGLMDDFGIWDGALSDTQIAALAAGENPLSVRSLAPHIGTDIAATMRNVSATAHLRVPFTIADPAGINLMVLRMRYDDGFTAYLNGTEIMSRNVTGITARASGAALEQEELDVSRYAPLLVAGTNVLALRGHNVSAADADFLLQPELTTGSSVPGRYFIQPTPGTWNGVGYTGIVTDTNYTPQRGFYTTPQTVSISCATPGAVIVTTTDGSIPTLTNGTQSPAPASVLVSTTTTLRAIAFVPGSELAPSNVDTHTYLYAAHVATQTRPAAAPVTWPGGHPGDYTMDPRIVTGALPGYGVTDALLSLPTLSITAAPEDIWGPGGVYANSTARGDAYERAASAEWMDPAGGDGFHVRFGLAIHGNISRDKGFTPKHSLKMFFRSQYGATKLNHALFPDSTVTSYDQLILRAGSTDTFPCVEWGTVGLGPGGAPYQRWARAWASYIRDQWVRDTQIAMGHPSAHGRYCHLYLNGIYWGLYNVCEHPDEDFMESHLGAPAADYDVLVDFAELKNGDYTAWTQLMTLAGGSMTDAIYWQVQGRNADGTVNAALPPLLNMNNFIDYMLLHVAHGADDWPNHNWWSGRATRNTAGLNTGFHFFAWDQEISNENLLYERTSWQSAPAKRTDVSAGQSPAIVYASLKANSPLFRRHFADRVHRHLFNDGALTNASSLARWNARLAEIDHAIVAESARWGDYQANLTNPGQPYRREVEWLAHKAWMEANYWNAFAATQVQTFRSAGLYPALHAPVINQFGGEYAPGFTAVLSHTNATGAIRYTTNGTDPITGGTVYASPLALSGTVTVKARVQDGATWSALLETTFRPDLDLDNDLLPDAWEALYSLNNADPADAAQDSDSDGGSNLREYAAGTHPRNGGSAFTAVSVTDATGLRIQFTAQPGRSYRLEGSDEMTTWDTIRTMAPVAAAGPAEFLLNPTAPRRFYRCVAVVVNP